MAEFVYNEVQLVQPSASAVLSDAIGCNKGYVLHRPGSGLLTVRGIVNNPCCRFARYRVMYDGNIAIPTDATPADVDQYWNVSGFAIIDIPVGCCYAVSVVNASALA